MRTIAVTNQKGGSGKTTTAVNLAAALAAAGHRVLVVDLDPQANASLWLRANDGGSSLLQVLTEGAALAPLVRGTEVAGLEIIPSSLLLGRAEPALAGEPGAEGILRGAVQKLPRRWDFLLVDCPPSLGLLAISALVACREVLVPVEAHPLALAGLAGLMETVDRVRKRLNPSLTVSAILACRVSRTRLARDVVDQMHERFGELVLRTAIRESVRLAESSSARQPVTLYDPASAGAEDYRAAAVELLKKAKGRKA